MNQTIEKINKTMLMQFEKKGVEDTLQNRLDFFEAYAESLKEERVEPEHFRQHAIHCAAVLTEINRLKYRIQNPNWY